MVTLETSHKVLSSLLGKKISLKELEEVLFDLGMELDDIDGDNLKIDITTERPDMVSPQGLARALRAYLGKKNPEYTAKTSDYVVNVDKSLEGIRPCTVCAVVKGLNFDDEAIKEIIWVQEKLHATFGRNRKKVAIGIYPMEHITFPITFKADAPNKIKFKPLEAEGEMNGKQILEEHPTGKSYAHLLEGKKRYPFFVDGKNNILSMPPIINSEQTGRVTEKTKEVFIECSGFDYTALSQTLNILVYLFQDLGGEVYECTLNYPKEQRVTPNLCVEKRSIDSSMIKKMLGLDLSGEEIAPLLEKMMHRVVKINADSVDFEVPPIRTDIWHDVDITDDVARAYGINNLEYSLPPVATQGKVLFENRIAKQISELLIGSSFQEVFTLALSNKDEQFKKMGVKAEKGAFIELGHSEEASINMVRTWLMPEVLKSLVCNRSREYPQKVFEIDEVVLVDKKSDVLSQNRLKCCGLLADATTDYTRVKQLVVYVLESLGLKDVQFSVNNHNSFLEGRAATITSAKVEIGFLGELHPRVLTGWEMEMPVAGFEIDVDAIADILRK